MIRSGDRFRLTTLFFCVQTPPGTPRMSEARRKIRRLLNKTAAINDNYWFNNFHHSICCSFIHWRHFDSQPRPRSVHL